MFDPLLEPGDVSHQCSIIPFSFIYLVVSTNPSEQYEFVSWDDDMFNWMKLMFQTTRYPLICHKMPGFPMSHLKPSMKTRAELATMLNWSSRIIIPNVVEAKQHIFETTSCRFWLPCGKHTKDYRTSAFWRRELNGSLAQRLCNKLPEGHPIMPNDSQNLYIPIIIPWGILFGHEQWWYFLGFYPETTSIV